MPIHDGAMSLPLSPRPSLHVADHPIDPRPLLASTRRWPAIAGPVISVMILAAVVYQLRAINVRTLLGLVPTDVRFWLCFPAYYLAAPVSEWVIFRRLWSLPASGIVALLRKLVSNEILLGYLGEVYFYAWARRHVVLSASPFGAIKDVAVLSAVVGNAFCLVMMTAAWSAFGAMDLGPGRRAIYLSAALVLLSSFAAMLFRRRLFTLPAGELWRISAIHAVRVVGASALAAAMWHLMLPTVAFGCWLILAAARQIVSRLPLLPNKDLAFAGIAALLVGDGNPVAVAMTLMASLLMLAHVCVGAALVIAELAGERTR